MSKIEFEIKPENKAKFWTIVAIAAAALFVIGIGVGKFLGYVVNG